jgi:polar amino acid transport system substrate-binding protein
MGGAGGSDEEAGTVSGGLRGWGGVTAIAAACALALTAATAPPGDGGGTDRAAARRPAPLTRAQYALGRQAPRTQQDADNCDASLDPASGSTDGAAVRKIVDRGYLIAGVDQNSYQWGFRDPATGDLAGFDIDLVKAIAADILGDPGKVQYRTVPTNRRVDRIKDGTVDMVVRTMTINCDRAGDVAFSTAYFTAGQQILVPKGSSVTGYNTTLKDKRVCTADSSTGEDKLTGTDDGSRQSDAERFGVKQTVTVPNQLDCLVRLQLGLVDAVFTDNALAAGQAAQDPAVHLVGETVTEEPYGVAMHRDATDLVRRVNRVLERYRAGGSDSPWTRSYVKWLRADLPGISGPPGPAYR